MDLQGDIARGSTLYGYLRTKIAEVASYNFISQYIPLSHQLEMQYMNQQPESDRLLFG